MNKSVLILIGFLFNIVLGISQNKQAVTDFQNKSIFKNSSISFLVQDVNGKDIVSLNKSKSLTPASTLKLVTTATALEVLGRGFRYKTILNISDNEINIVGSGDPTLGSTHLYQNPKAFLAEWTNYIKESGVKSPLTIRVQDNLFGYKGTSAKWIREDMGNYYAAGAYGISVFDNTYQLFFNTMDTSKPPIILRTEPEMKDIEFVNMLEYNTSGKDNGYIWGEPFSNKRILTGDIPAKKTSFSIKGDIPDPGLFLGETIAQELTSNGFIITDVRSARNEYFDDLSLGKKQISDAGVNQSSYIHQSPALQNIIRVINVKSNNHYAEHIIRTLGRKNNSDIYSDPLKEGIELVNNYWAGKGFDMDALFMYDGCGLSPSNAVSAKFMCDVLRYMMVTSRNADAFLSSIPKAGQEGTVRNFLKGTRLDGKVYVKSGSIANVQSYAGYYIDGDKKYVFAIIINNFQGKNRREVVKGIESLLLETFPQ